MRPCCQSESITAVNVSNPVFLLFFFSLLSSSQLTRPKKLKLKQNKKNRHYQCPSYFRFSEQTSSTAQCPFCRNDKPRGIKNGGTVARRGRKRRREERNMATYLSLWLLLFMSTTIYASNDWCVCIHRLTICEYVAVEY